MSTTNFKSEYDMRPYNPVRILQWVFCTICLGIAVYILLDVTWVPVIIKSILFLTSIAYVFLTFVDLILIWLLKPFQWTSWIILSLTGALMFFLCTGLLMILKHPLGIVLYLMAIILNCITGMLFLTDFFNIITWLLNRFAEVEPIHIKSPCTTPTCSIDTTPSSPQPVQKRSSNKSIQFPGEDKDFLLLSNDKCVQCSQRVVPAKGRFTCAKESYAKRYESVPSHGGTFHVSRDVAPMSPSPLRCPKYGTPSRSPSAISELMDNKRDKDECISQREKPPVSPRSRTVAISVRTVPRQSDELSCTPAKQPCQSGALSQNELMCCNELQDTNETAAEIYRPRSSPSCCQMVETFPSTVQHYFTAPCSYCGRVHRQIATVQAIGSSRDTHNTCCRLPTVEENPCFDSAAVSDAPTKDNGSCAPCQSPASTTTSNRLSPSSCSSPNTARRTSSRASSIQQSPRSMSCTNKRSSNSIERAICQQSSQSSLKQSPDRTEPYDSCKQPLYPSLPCQPSSSRTDELDMERPKIVGGRIKRPCVLFGFEPIHKHEGVQTDLCASEIRREPCPAVKIREICISECNREPSPAVNVRECNTSQPNRVPCPAVRIRQFCTMPERNQELCSARNIRESTGTACDTNPTVTPVDRHSCYGDKALDYGCNESQGGQRKRSSLYGNQAQNSELITVLPGAVDCSTSSATENTERYITLPCDSKNQCAMLTIPNASVKIHGCSESCSNFGYNRERQKNKCEIM